LTDDHDKALRASILENMGAAVSGGYGAALLAMSDRQIAEDLQARGNLEDEEIEAMLPHIEEWRKSMAGRELPEGDEELSEEEIADAFRAQLQEQLGDSARVEGPVFVRGGRGLSALLGRLGGGGDEAPSRKARQFDVMQGAADNLTGLLNSDKCDQYQPSEREWTSIPGAHAPMFSACASEVRGSDQHVYVLARDADISLKWRFWSLCPASEMSAPIIILGDEKRARHRADLMMDLANAKLGQADFYAMATGTPVKKRRKTTEAAAPGEQKH
jgi:hypothetical protein